MALTRIAMLVAPGITMMVTMLGLSGSERWMSSLGTTVDARMILGRVGMSIPYTAAAAIGVSFLIVARGSLWIRSVGTGVLVGAAAVVTTAVTSEAMRLASFVHAVPVDESVLTYLDPATAIGATLAVFAGVFALRVAMHGDAAFARSAPRRVSGKRAIYGDADWMSVAEAKELFPESGGIVVGEAYRVDQDSVAGRRFRSRDPRTWGAGGQKRLLCFDVSFGSTHGLIFAGSGSFKTMSVTVPTALKWSGGLIALDPSSEAAPMVMQHRRRSGRDLHVLDPKDPTTGFNVLDWIGSRGGSKEEDIVAVANWVVTDTGRHISIRDDFFRGSALQLITALIADVCLSGQTEKESQHLRQMRMNLAEPEPRLRERLQKIYDNSGSDFVKENVAPFIAMTPETFSGVYSSAVKETHWLSYPNYAALVSGSSFSTDDIAQGKTDVFINLNLKTLDTQPGLARTIIGALLNAIYNRDGEVAGRTLFLLDEVTRLGYMRVIETARDAGRKYGITLVLLFQSMGQMRETYGGVDAISKWFESTSWIAFAAINDPDTAKYISERCGNTTVEVDQLSQSSQISGSSRTRSRQLVQRALILPEEVLRMRTDEQIVFAAGNPPLRCGRAIWFRRQDMKAVVAENRFHPKEEQA